MEILLVSFLMYVIFHITLVLLLSKLKFNKTLLYQNEGGGNTVTRTSISLSFKFVVETIIHHYYCMLVKPFI